MKRFAAPVLLVAASLSLQGCVAAVLPLAAAGVIGKTRLDAAKRAERAQAGMASRPVQTIAVQDEPIVAEPVAAQEMAVETHGAATAADFVPDMSHPYAPLVRYALDRVAARATGEDVRSAVLVEDISLTDPRAMSCGSKPFAVIIDIDTAPGAVPLAQPGLAALLDTLRAAEIRIGWIGEGNIAAIETALEKAGEDGNPLVMPDDAILSAPNKGPRKQEQRGQFAKGHCVLAIAGDRKSDFDELFDYLRDPTYAIGLDIFSNRGWFLVPSPLGLHVENTP